MAENCTLAFGRYLKTLRERCGFSLYDVCSLSQTFPEKINKGYLSRCENGHQKLAFPKVIALSRIYQVPADVLLERMELDMELDRVGGPETEDISFAELVAAGQRAVQLGFHWDAYAYLRDAVPLSGHPPVRPNYANLSEQIAIAFMNSASTARSLGRVRFALHEFLYLRTTGDIGEKLYPVILERISSCYQVTKDLPLAEHLADSAIRRAEAQSDSDYVGFMYSLRGRLAVEQGDPRTASHFYEKAFRSFQQTDQKSECARALNNLATCYFDMKRYGAARRASSAAGRISSSLDQLRSSAFSKIIQGEIDEVENRPQQATRLWREAAQIARELNDKELRFKAELVLFRQALKAGDGAVARAIQRRLNRLSVWLPSETPEVTEFRLLVSKHEQLTTTSVAETQRPH